MIAPPAEAFIFTIRPALHASHHGAELASPTPVSYRYREQWSRGGIVIPGSHGGSDRCSARRSHLVLVLPENIEGPTQGKQSYARPFGIFGMPNGMT